MSQGPKTPIPAFLTAATIPTLLLAAACSSPEQPTPGPDQSTGVNLLDGTWKYMKGTTPTNAGLNVAHTSEAILQFPDDEQPTKENSKYIPNAPINRYGERVGMAQSGNVAITAHMTDIKGLSSISIYGTLPTLHDENRWDKDAVTVRFEGANVTVSEQGDYGAKPEVNKIALDAPVEQADVTITQSDAGLEVAVNGKSTTFNAKPLDKEAWIGFDAGESFTVTSLTAKGLNGNQVSGVDMSKATFDNAKRTADGLAGTAEANGHGNKQLGTAVDIGPLMEDPEYAKFIINNANEIQTEMLAKPQALQPEKGNWQFAELDGLIDFAEKNGMTVHLHTPVFNEANPEWLTNELAKADKAEAEALLKDMVQTPILRYKDSKAVTSIDVVNEPFDPDNWGKLNENNPWYKALGKDYIGLAIKYARQANPDLKLVINDWAIDTDEDRRDGMEKLVKDLTDEGNKPDAVGIQTHYFEDDLNDDDVMDGLYSGQLSKTFKEFGKLGVDVRISELSVAENDDDDTKADIYAMETKACMEADNCMGVNAWGWTQSEQGFFYFTGNPESADTGDDAPTTQKAGGKVAPGKAWKAMLAEVSKKR